MELLIALACIFLLIVGIQVFLYKLRKKEKKNLRIGYSRLIEYMDDDDNEEASRIMSELLQNPRLTLKQLETIKTYIVEIDNQGFDDEEIVKLKDLVYQKELNFRRYPGY